MPRKETKQDVDQILQEIRIVLPGTQALMGFQFIAFFNPVFQNLSSHLKLLHFATLLLTILCSILLIAPVAFKQISEDGNATKRFISFTRLMLGCATFLLLLSFSGDVYLAARVIDMSNIAALLISLALFSTGIFFWYIVALYRKNS